MFCKRDLKLRSLFSSEAGVSLWLCAWSLSQFPHWAAKWFLLFSFIPFRQRRRAALLQLTCLTALKLDGRPLCCVAQLWGSFSSLSGADCALSPYNPSHVLPIPGSISLIVSYTPWRYSLAGGFEFWTSLPRPGYFPWNIQEMLK